MYVVISRWRPLAGREEDFERITRSMRAIMRSQPGVTFMQGFKGPDCFYAIHAYDDEATYRRVTEDPHGPFARAASEHMLEEVAEWLGSVKGPSLD